jgi:quercetin dioxygenase-like cupin family protein
MTERTLAGAVAKSGMHDLSNVASLVEIQPEATVSRTVLQAEGARVVLFSFDAGQVLTEHTAAVPALLQVLDGHLRITADGRTVDLRPGGLVHLAARLPHAVESRPSPTPRSTVASPRPSTPSLSLSASSPNATSCTSTRQQPERNGARQPTASGASGHGSPPPLVVP